MISPQSQVLFLIRSLHVGGAERQLVTLAKGLKKRGISVRVAVFYPGGALEKDLVGAGISLVSLDKRGRWDIFPFFLRLVRLLRLSRPDFFHSYLPGANLVATLVKFFCRAVGLFGGSGLLKWTYLNMIGWPVSSLYYSNGFPVLQTSLL